MGFSILRFREEKEKFLQKSQIPRGEEKFEIPFSSFERRKRNLQKDSLFFQEGKEKWIFFSQISRGDSPNVRRDAADDYDANDTDANDINDNDVTMMLMFMLLMIHDHEPQPPAI